MNDKEKIKEVLQLIDDPKWESWDTNNMRVLIEEIKKILEE